MIITKKKMKKNYYYLMGGQPKNKPQPTANSKPNSPIYRIAKQIGTKVLYGLYIGPSHARNTRTQYKTRLLNSKLIKKHFTVRTKKQEAKIKPLTQEEQQKQTAKLTEFQKNLLQYEKNPDHKFKYETTKGNFVTKGLRNLLFKNPKKVQKESTFSEELKNMIKYVKVKESLTDKYLRYAHESSTGKKTSEKEYINSIKSRLATLLGQSTTKPPAYTSILRSITHPLSTSQLSSTPTSTSTYPP